MAQNSDPKTKQQTGTNCPPPAEEKPDKVYGCLDLPKPLTPPTVDEPKECTPPADCNCPGKSVPTPSCFPDLIADQATLIAAGERAARTKADLEKLLEDAKKAKESYTRKKADEFKEIWLAQDKAIVGAIKTVTCNVPCWKCVIECHVCQLLYRIRWIEKYVDGSGDQLINPVRTLRDLEYWHLRNVAAKQKRFDRIEKVLKAWSDPAKSIDAALKANQQIIDAVPSMNPAESVIKVFFDLIVRHQAIGPRDEQTSIKGDYIRLCTNDTAEKNCDPDDEDKCCGPDVGLPSARQRLIEPQAYIVDPENYFKILCCLAVRRFGPAKLQLEDAKADLAATSAEIVKLQAELDGRLKDPLADYRANVGKIIDCEIYEKKDGTSGGTQAGNDGCGCDDEPTEPAPESESEETSV